MDDKLDVYVTNEELAIWACRCFDEAEKLGLRLPHYANPDIEYFFESRGLGRIIGEDCVPYLLSFIGNKTRLKAKLCKFIVLDFLVFLLERVPDRKNLPHVNHLLDTHIKEVILGSYGAYAKNASRLQTGPRLMLKGKNTLTIENKVNYPNAYNIRNSLTSTVMLKFFTMRYKLNEDETASLIPLPAFRYDASLDTVQPKGKDLDGYLASLTYCTQAQEIKTLVTEAVSVLLGDTDVESKKRLLGKLVDFAQLIAGIPIEFIRSSEQPSLFPDMYLPVRANADLDFYELNDMERQELIDQIELVYSAKKSSKDQVYFAVELGDTPIGSITLSKEKSFNALCESKLRHLEGEGCFGDERWYVRKVFLHRSFRGYGIGKLIYYLAFEAMSDLRKKSLFIASEDCNVSMDDDTPSRAVSKEARSVWRSILKDELLPSRYGISFVYYEED